MTPFLVAVLGWTALLVHELRGLGRRLRGVGPACSGLGTLRVRREDLAAWDRAERAGGREFAMRMLFGGATFLALTLLDLETVSLSFPALLWLVPVSAAAGVWECLRAGRGLAAWSMARVAGAAAGSLAVALVGVAGCAAVLLSRYPSICVYPPQVCF